MNSVESKDEGKANAMGLFYKAWVSLYSLCSINTQFLNAAQAKICLHSILSGQVVLVIKTIIFLLIRNKAQPRMEFKHSLVSS